MSVGSPPSSPEQRPPARGLLRISFEWRVFLGALLVALPGFLVAALVIASSEVDASFWWVLMLFAALTTLALAASLRRHIVFPLYTLSNLLEALREGDFSLRGSRAQRNDAIGDVVWEVNALSRTLRDQRLPPTVGLRHAVVDWDLLPGAARAPARPLRTVLSTNSAFGGNNSAVILGVPR